MRTASGNPRVAGLWAIPKTALAVAASSKKGSAACAVTPPALMSAEPTKKLHGRR
jgi:hypothetical protein